jgi:predicted ArsR family transcriptional regulator
MFVLCHTSFASSENFICRSKHKLFKNKYEGCIVQKSHKSHAEAKACTQNFPVGGGGGRLKIFIIYGWL